MSLQRFTAHFLLALNNIPLSGMHHGLSAHLLKNILVDPKFWQLWIKFQYTSMYRLLCGHIFITPLGKGQGMELLNCMVRTCFILLKKKKTQKHQSGWTIIPSSDTWEFLLYFLFSALGVKLQILVILTGVWQNLIVLLCISLETYDVGYFFIFYL